LESLISKTTIMTYEKYQNSSQMATYFNHPSAIGLKYELVYTSVEQSDMKCYSDNADKRDRLS
jgi:hypothetical protein